MLGRRESLSGRIGADHVVLGTVGMLGNLSVGARVALQFFSVIPVEASRGYIDGLVLALN